MTTTTPTHGETHTLTPSPPSTPLLPAPTPQPLPRVLQPWHDWLQWFPHESALAIGGMLPRLHAAMGRYRGTLQRGAHTPNGIDELRRRGPYHRLLLSEWALADEVPDEFLRRASSGEHLFLSPRYETLRADAEIVAVFDSGPAQFGAPRLAHIALWILLARRAEEAGIGFRWGLLDAPGALDAGGDAAALKRMLAARTLHHADATRIAAWRDALAAELCQSGERWCIGGAREATDAFSHRVAIARDLHTQLRVEIVGAGGRRDVEVPLPPDKASARLLRGGFAYEVAATHALETKHEASAQKLSLRQPPLIGPEGRRIVVPVLGESAAMIYDLAPSAKKSKKSQRKMRWGRGSELVFAAMSGKSFGGVVADRSYLFFWQIEGFGVVSRPDNTVFQAPPGQAHWLPALWFNSGSRPHQIFVIDAAHRLSMFEGSRPDRTGVLTQPIDTDVIAMARTDADSFAYLRYRGGMLELMLRHRRSAASRRLAQVSLSAPPDKGFLFGLRYRDINAWCVRMERGREGGASFWALYRYDQRTPSPQVQVIQVASGWSVVGLTPVPGTASEFGLVAITADRKRLMLLRVIGSDTLYASARSITAASVATDTSLIAFITEDRQLIALTPGGETRRWNADTERDDG
ncbi:MAG: hypothetical protein IT473_00020 [Lysobacter sp.]|nr:hypothetical protein [Lysobacter sp.]